MMPRLVAVTCILLTASLLVACGQAPTATMSPAGATSQAQQARLLATQMAQGLQATLQYQEQAATATAEAIQSLLAGKDQWQTLLYETFDNNLNDWPTGEDQEASLARILWTLDQGHYRWQAQAIQGFVWWAYPEMEEADDFYLAADVQQVEGPPTGEVGLIFRLNELDEYYLYEIDAQGNFAVFIRQQDGWETLYDWSESRAILPESPNRLAVAAQGSQLYFFINEQFVGSLIDNHLPSGKAGVLVGLSNEGDRGVWQFDNFELRRLPGS
jgi:hypothetical protein